MTRTLLALAAALVARATAAQALPPGLAGDVRLDADQVSYEPSTGRVLLAGNAVVRRGQIVLRARSIEYDPASGEVRASGGVLLTDPTRVVSADAVRAVLGGDVEAEGVLAFLKDQPVDLSAVAAADEAGRIGRNRLRFSTPRLRADSGGRLQLVNARLTLCDCPGGAPPAWELTAREADVIPGKRAILRGTVLRITPPFVGHTVPILPLPWLYLPLGDRQTGLLLPTVGSTGASGFAIAQPVFITLGRSADATVTPEYAFGRKRSDVAEGGAYNPAVRGPGARLELRWAPAEGAEGRADAIWLRDLDLEPGGTDGDRFALFLGHTQRVGDRTSLAARLQLFGDSVFLRDTTSDLQVQRVPYRRSDLLASYRRDAVVAEAVASYVQPLDPYVVTTLAGVSTLAPYGPLGADRGVSSRFGAAAATLVPEAVGPLRLSGRLGAARFGPIHGVGGTALDVVGRPTVTRGDARGEVGLPLLLGDAVTFAPFLRGAALGYAPEGGQSRGVSWAIAGASLETELSRRFGAVRHVIAPRLEWRAGTSELGDPLAVPAYDHLDRSTVGLLSATPGVFQQLRAAIATRVETASATVFRAELGQDADLRAGRLAETFAALGVAAGPVTADATARFFLEDRPVPVDPKHIPSRLDELSELRVTAGVRDPLGNGVYGGFLSVGPGGSARLVAGLDPLFDRRPAAINAAASGTVGVRAVLASARVGYEALIPGRAAFVPSCTANPDGSSGDRRVEAFQVQQHSASLSWEPPCRCFRIALAARINDCGGYGYSASIDLGRLGGVVR